ncbi:glycerol-3-phosphate dehydrogenase/oxidase [Oceanobacillus sp. FSL H7-0719]|uniref:glycerol-3-phosphate dehydrogenase/oxidase n=1 Tax=Oceanobacillus sp. FSL H7-0719 TaxID=2954507 RepID=UPI0032548E52
MKKLSSLNRKEQLENIEKETFDIIIIGGGITGAGIALDAVTRGMKPLLIEMQDFAGGTSSRSTKLIHGGLRYLQQFEVKMVADVGKERAIVYENGPHVTTPEWMLLPFHKGSNLGPFTTNIGLRVYDFLAGVKRTERRKMLSIQETLEKEPLVKKQDLKGSGYYVEYKTDDARLTIEVMKKAAEKGADALNYVKAADFIYDENNQVVGVIAVDQITEKSYEFKGKKVINASGPWVDQLREKDGSKQGKTLLLTKGIHLVFDKSSFPLEQAVYFDTPDKRMIFAIPREGKTYVGTTDTVYDGDIIHPLVTKEDRDYVLKAIDYMFPDLGISTADVESSWAGLRPLIAEEGKNSPSEVSRKDEIFVSDSGLITIAGGKLTGYRKMAEQIIDVVAEQFKEEIGVLYSASSTKKLPVSGGEVGGSKGFNEFKALKLKEAIKLGMDEANANKLIQTYGANSDTVFNYYEQYQTEAAKYEINPIIFAELLYAIENEAAYKPSDFFVRRTGALYFNIALVKQAKEKVICFMAERLAWSEQQTEDYREELDQLLTDAVTFA